MAEEGSPESRQRPGTTPRDSAPDSEPASRPGEGAAGEPSADPTTGPDAFAETLHSFAEAREYAVHWAAAEIDRFKLRIRRTVIWIIIGIVALVILLAILATATGMLLWGLASMIVSLLGWPMWAGALMLGGGVLLIAVLALVLDLWGWNREGFKAARRRFEARKQSERNKFGRSVDPQDDRAAHSRHVDPGD